MIALVYGFPGSPARWWGLLVALTRGLGPRGVGTGVSWKVPETWCPRGFLGVPNTAPGSVLVFDQPLVSYGSVCGQNGGRSGPSSLKLVSSR